MQVRWGPIPAVVATAVVAVSSAEGKEFTSLAAAESRGDSRAIRAPTDVIDLLFAATGAAQPRGGYLRLYPLGADGFVGLPGRFNPATAAVCLGRDQSRPPRGCQRAPAALERTLRPLRRLVRFHGVPTTVNRLTSPRIPRPVRAQLEAVFELAFDRRRLSRPTSRPSRCLTFTVRWTGPDASRRPSRSCLSPVGVYAGGRMYPLGRGPWALAWANLER